MAEEIDKTRKQWDWLKSQLAWLHEVAWRYLPAVVTDPDGLALHLKDYLDTADQALDNFNTWFRRVEEELRWEEPNLDLIFRTTKLINDSKLDFLDALRDAKEVLVEIHGELLRAFLPAIPVVPARPTLTAKQAAVHRRVQERKRIIVGGPAVPAVVRK